MRRIAVVTAWIDRGDPYRRRSFEWTQWYWRQVFPDAEHLVATPIPFTRPAAINAGVRRSRADVVLQVDPDSFVGVPQALEAVELAGDAPGLVAAFDRYLYLDTPSSALIYLGRTDGGLVLGNGLLAEDAGPGGVGNVVAFSRETWEAVGGFDERFDGVWGGDDGAFAYATDALVAPLRRVPGPMYHLWHPRPPESVPGHPEYLRQFSILERYRDAVGDIEAMRAAMPPER